MNARLFALALMVSALPYFAWADAAGISLNKGDFISAEKKLKNGETVVSVKLSKSGKAKFKKLNKDSVNSQVHSEVAGVSSDLKLREPVKGDSLEMGPFSNTDAEKIIGEINQR